MLEFTALELNGWVSQYFYPFARIAGCLGVMPLLGSKLVPRQIRILLSVFITLIIAPLLPPMPNVEPMSLASFIIIFEQMLIGIVLGFMVEIVTQVFVLAGQLIAMQTGLGIATTVDPAQGVSVVVVSQWFLFLTSLTFLALNGHLVVIEVVVESFYTMPIGGGAWTADDYGRMVRWGGWMFASALVIALPALTSLLIVNFAFGVMTRAAPQLNIFSLGFPVTMLVGLAIIWLTIGHLGESFHTLLETLFGFLRSLIRTP
ncbi:MAG: flagellar biosynthetic protein FliR [Oleispira sp.]|jgi:flagellar biosynthetic protein FliR